MTYIERLASFASELKFDRVPAPVRQRAREILLDSCGAILAGLREEEFQNFAPRLARQGKGPAVTALLLGAAGVAIELDEGCAASRGHPGIHIVPSILAQTLTEDHDLEDMLGALIAGYEVAARLGRATTFRDGLHPHGTWGVCGAAVAVGKLRDFDAGQLAEAIRVSASLPIATNYEAVHQGTTVRNLWSGLGNFNGTLATDLVLAGFTGPADMPARVFGETLGSAFDRAGIVADLGERFMMLGNYFKAYACCRHTHASVDALRKIIERESLDANAIEKIDVATYARAVDATGRPDRPQTPLSAKFSLAYILSTYIKHGKLDHEAFIAPTLDDEAIAELATKVAVTKDAALTAMLPATRAARVTVRLAGGQTLVGEAHGSRGDPDDPLDPAEIVAKFIGLAKPGIGEDRSRSFAKDIVEGQGKTPIQALFLSVLSKLPQAVGNAAARQ